MSLEFNWEPGFCIETQVIDSKITLKLNKEGLISLARILNSLASDEIPNNYHLHLDDSNSLEDGSNEIIIEKVSFSV